MGWKWQLHTVDIECYDIIFEDIKCYVPQKILGKNPDLEYYNKEVKQLQVNMRKMYNMRKFGQSYQADLKQFTGSKESSGKIFTFGLTKQRKTLDRVI